MMPGQTRRPAAPSPASLDRIEPEPLEHRFARQQALERRLDDGYRRIEQARVDGADVRAWEDFWIQLLREYEGLCDEIDRFAA
jgi:hypothetical protein